MTIQPEYPVFVPSKGRSGVGMKLTVDTLIEDGVPFRLVVEPSEVDAYRRRFPAAELLVTPRDEMRLLGVRNWIADVSVAEGAERHWQIDDNIQYFRRLHRGLRIPVNAGAALRVCEIFTDRYENIGVSGLNYQGFVSEPNVPPFYLNCHVYSCSLIWNRMPYRWREIYNDDTDLCLQVLSGGLCTVALNTYMVNKLKTMLISGGNTDDLYRGDGRLRMAKALERRWPGVVSTRRRWDRPQHVVRGSWRGFDTPLRRRTDLDWSALPAVDELGLRAVQVADEVRSPEVRALLDDE